MGIWAHTRVELSQNWFMYVINLVINQIKKDSLCRLLNRRAGAENNDRRSRTIVQYSILQSYARDKKKKKK